MDTAVFHEATSLDDELRRWVHCEEALLVEMALTHHGYGAKLVFNLTWDSVGVLRSDLAERERRLTIEMHAVHRLHLEGGLSQSMVDHPEAFNWGLSEVELVCAEECPDGIRPRVIGGHTRSIVIDAHAASVTEPEDTPPTS